MAQPSNATVQVDGKQFNAYSAHVGVETSHDFSGMPAMGRPTYSISCSVDVSDTKNMPFDNLKQLFELANAMTRDKIVDMKVQFWTDENQTDAISTYTFRGWISAFHNSGGAGGNHMLNLTFTPELDAQQFVKIEIGN